MSQIYPVTETDIVPRLRHLAKLLGVGNFDIPAALNEAADEIKHLRDHVQTPAFPDRERMAEILYTAAHKGLRNCWKWSDAGLDHEHPTSRGYWYKIADGALAALEDTSTLGNSNG